MKQYKVGDKVQITATRNYEDRIVNKHTYDGTVIKGYTGDRQNSIEFKDKWNTSTMISMSSCLDESWFKIRQKEINKNIKVL